MYLYIKREKKYFDDEIHLQILLLSRRTWKFSSTEKGVCCELKAVCYIRFQFHYMDLAIVKPPEAEEKQFFTASEREFAI